MQRFVGVEASEGQRRERYFISRHRDVGKPGHSKSGSVWVLRSVRLLGNQAACQAVLTQVETTGIHSI